MTRWFDNTSLDFSLLDPSLQSQIASVATTTEDFFQKYIITNRQADLKRELEILLSTTEEYAGNLTSSIFDYFLKYYNAGQLQNPLQPSENQPSNLGEYPPLLAQSSPPNLVIDAISKAETLALIQQANLEKIQAFASQLNEHKAVTSQEIESAKEETKNELSNLKKEIAHITDVLHRLADSFNQLRQFVEEYTRQPPQQVPVQSPPPNMYPPPSPAVSVYGAPLQQQQLRPYNTPGTPGTSPYQAGGGAPVNDLDMIQSTGLMTNAPDTVRIDRKVCLWVKRTEARVTLDYIALDSCVACTWKIHTIGKDGGSLRVGFMADNGGQGDEAALRDTGFELRNDGYIVFRKFREKCQQFFAGDTIRVELNLAQKYAVFFLNEQLLPFRIINIPQLCRFYIYGSGANTCAEATNLLVIPALTVPPNRVVLRDLDASRK